MDVHALLNPHPRHTLCGEQQATRDHAKGAAVATPLLIQQAP
jgi:hypothetical protein